MLASGGPGAFVAIVILVSSEGAQSAACIDLLNKATSTWLAARDTTDGEHDKRLADLESAYKMVVESCPDFTEGKVELGGVQMLLGEYKEAAETLGLAVQNDPENERALQFLFAALFDLGEWESAASVFEEILSHGFDRRIDRMKYALTLQKLNRPVPESLLEDDKRAELGRREFGRKYASYLDAISSYYTMALQKLSDDKPEEARNLLLASKDVPIPQGMSQEELEIVRDVLSWHDTLLLSIDKRESKK